MKNIILLTLTWTVLAECPKGYQQYKDACEDMRSPDTGPSVPTPTSDEKPSRHPEPAWQRGEVNAETPPSCAYTNNCSDQKAIDAAKQGKKAAGIKQIGE